MKVKHRFGEYEIVQQRFRASLVGMMNVFAITDANVAAYWGADLRSIPIHVVEPGERSKSIAEYERCLDWLVEQGANRSSQVVALGGGVVGDLAGFAAATYMRGIRYVQVPTTLLAMVDSSIGGKVGVNLSQGKNLVGAFHPPSKVVLDYEMLGTLPLREFNNGAAEIYKYGAILDREIFDQLEAKPLGPGDVRIPELVTHCISLKRKVVEADELERTGERAILNFGHTVGHALEKAQGFGATLHGEAISVGMVVEAALGEELRLTPAGTATRLRAVLKSQSLPVTTDANPHELLAIMRRDKKGVGNGLAFALLTEMGSCKLVTEVPETVVFKCLREHL